MSRKITTFRAIFLGFLGVIIIGTLLLMLPIAVKGDGHARFSEAFFTATSAVCVTGLVVRDTAVYWTIFGKCIILLLIQVGGMGVVTVAVAISMLLKKRIGLAERSAMQESISAFQVGGIVKMTSFIIKTVFVIEGIGACALMFVFIPEYGVAKGICYSIFHSISAFCNAGFDLMGEREMFSSMVAYQKNVIVNLVLMFMIIAGGIGFKTWDDIRLNKIRIKQYGMQSKMVLSISVVLILIPATYFFFWEYANLPVAERILSSFFQAVTPRTAGFNTSNLVEFSDTGKVILIFLMLIGGSSGSTAGGIKLTTISVLLAAAKAVFTQKSDVTAYGRRIENEAVTKAGVIFMMYNILFFIAGIMISHIEKLPVLDCLFESASAIATVGLTLGITAKLGICSRVILILLMILGRVGGLTVIFAVLSENKANKGRFPVEKISVG